MLAQKVPLTISNLKIAYLEQVVIENKKNSDKGTQVFRGYRITFATTGLWSFKNDTVRNFIVFVVDNSSSSHVDNR